MLTQVPSPWNPEELSQPQAVDEDAMDLMPLFAKQMSSVVDAFRSASRKSDVEDAARILHRVKGSAATYGFRRLAERAAEAEELVKRRAVAPAAFVDSLAATASRIEHYAQNI